MNATCPFCGEKSIVFSRPNFGRELAISCDDCGEFVISLMAIDRLGVEQERIALKSQILPSSDPSILRITLPAVGASEHGFEVESVLRSVALRSR